MEEASECSVSGVLRTAVGGIVVRLGDAVCVWTHPLTAALTDDGDELRVAAVRARRRALLLRTQRRARVRTVLTRTQQAAVGLELVAVRVRLADHLTRLGRLRCNVKHADNTPTRFVYADISHCISAVCYKPVYDVLDVPRFQLLHLSTHPLAPLNLNRVG